MKRTYTKQLENNFFHRPTEDVARALLGKVLVHQGTAGVTAGRIVEVEAYLYRNDAACHAARKQTIRNRPMFGPPGTAYVYLIYGLHYCFNVVTGLEGEGEAVLVRALEPLAGLNIMAERRGTAVTKKMAAGPGNLCRALAITKAHNGHNLNRPPLYLADDDFVVSELVTTTRVGINVATDLPLRFYIANNPFISRK
ncbi:MAG TPA: DNA-3-methyladenine glycosylase [Oscillospiraceae bacterium]|nr:DNA-3-methyladenine glycosylase [Oscillospiraceae bacterium]